MSRPRGRGRSASTTSRSHRPGTSTSPPAPADSGACRAGGDTLEPLIRDTTLWLNGIATGPGASLYVADDSMGPLLVEPASGRWRRVAAPAEATLRGIDGLYVHRGALVWIQNGVEPARVVQGSARRGWSDAGGPTGARRRASGLRGAHDRCRRGRYSLLRCHRPARRHSPRRPGRAGRLHARERDPAAADSAALTRIPAATASGGRPAALKAIDARRRGGTPVPCAPRAGPGRSKRRGDSRPRTAPPGPQSASTADPRSRRPRSPPAPARCLFPNSTTATKLFPLVPYIRFVPGYVRAPKDASDPHRAEVNGTGMLGPASLNRCTMSPVSRWNRLISPHGVRHVPKSRVSRPTAAASAPSFCSAVVPVAR